MNLTGPQQQQGPALSRLRAAKDLAAARDRPFAEFPLSEAHGLRVTRGDGSNGQVQFVQIEPCLTDQSRYCHAERSEASLCPSRETLRSAQGDKPSPILVVKIHYRPYTTLP